MFKRIDHVEIIPSNMEKALDFYTTILGFSLKTRIKVDSGPLEEVAFLQLGDTVLELVGIKNPVLQSLDPATVGYRMMALTVEDMEKAIEYLKTKGVEPSFGPINLPDRSKRAEIKDPDGLRIELREWQKK